MDRRTFLLTVGGLVSTTFACNRLPPLANAQASAAALATAVLAALVTNDRARLEALALSEEEFRDHVWPDLPAARPERNLPFSYVWGDLRQKSRAGLSRVLGQHGGREYDLLRVTFTESTDFRRYQVHRSASFHVSRAGNAETVIQVCGSMLQKDSMWKVFSYVVD